MSRKSDGYDKYLKPTPKGGKIGDIITDEEGKHKVVKIIVGAEVVLCEEVTE